MKELTIEQKAKAYDEAIERAKNLIKEMNEKGFLATDEEIRELFTELKESEDERIRNYVINVVNEWWDRLGDPTPDFPTQEDMLAWLEKKGEQKSVYKVEPKFKVEKDKWYVCISQYCNCIEGRNYKATSDGRIIDDYGTEYDMHSDAYQWFRPWTIQDAKDGDMIYVSTEEKGIQAIFYKYEGGIIYFHCSLCEDFIADGYMPIGAIEFVSPLQKVHYQRFFEKMHEAGYEWDAELKQLKKIEQKPAWSEEDEWFFEQLDFLIRNSYSVKDYYKKMSDWLKSLKDRYTWKPSEEQMAALRFVKKAKILDPEERESLNSLYIHLKELKKLMEE